LGQSYFQKLFDKARKVKMPNPKEMPDPYSLEKNGK